MVDGKGWGGAKKWVETVGQGRVGWMAARHLEVGWE